LGFKSCNATTVYNLIKETPFQFTLVASGFWKQLAAELVYIISEQLLRSALGFGVHIAMGAAAASTAELKQTPSISANEACGTKYRLMLLYTSNLTFITFALQIGDVEFINKILTKKLRRSLDSKVVTHLFCADPVDSVRWLQA
jgi:four helix bundle protein